MDAAPSPPSSPSPLAPSPSLVPHPHSLAGTAVRGDGAGAGGRGRMTAEPTAAVERAIPVVAVGRKGDIKWSRPRPPYPPLAFSPPPFPQHDSPTGKAASGDGDGDGA